MPDQLQLRGGTTTEHNSFTGASKEVTVDTTKKTLVVHDGATQGGIPLMKESGGNAATTVGIGTGGTNAINIDSSQRVGIGTASPSSTLEVKNSSGDAFLRLTGSVNHGVSYRRASDNAQIGYTGGGGGVNLGSVNLGLSASQANGNIVFQTGGTTAANERMRIDSSGNVSIGTTSTPSGLLNLRHATSNTILDLECVAANNGTTGNVIQFRGKGANGVSYHASQIKGITENGANNAGLLSFWTNNSGTVGERMRITSDGKVGIGTTTPNSLLTLNHATSPFLRLNDSNTTKIGLGADGGESFVFAQDNNPLVFTTNSGTGFSKRMRIAVDGKVGIGTDDPSTGQFVVYRQTVNSSNPIIQARSNHDSTNSVKFQIDGDGEAYFSDRVGINTLAPAAALHIMDGDVFLTDSTTATDSGQAVYFQSTTNGWTTSTAHSAIHGKRGVSSSGYLRFDTRESGTTAEKMRLTADGKLGLGTSVPAGKLDIQGSSANENQILLRSQGGGASLLMWNGQGVDNTGDSSRLGIGRDDVAMIYTSASGSPLSALAIGNTDAVPIVFSTSNAQRMRIDGGGRIMLNMTSPLDTTAGALNISGGTSGARIATQGTTTSAGAGIAEFFAHWTTNKVAGFIARSGTDTTNKDDGELAFFTRPSGGALAERLAITTSGRVLIAETATQDVDAYLTVQVGGASLAGITTHSGTTGNRHALACCNDNGHVGGITTANSATSFNTSSDYRLKENATAISDGITRLKTLKPYRFNWKVDSSTKVDGFFAHEVTAVPEAITGTKDEVVTQAMIDAGDYKEGTLNDPIYQAIDQSKLVPLLTAALQEAISKIETLEAKVAALEAA